jgi:hypothetical protein
MNRACGSSAAILVAAALLVCVFTACRRSSPASAPDVYTVRGRIVSLPDPARPTSEFAVRHEAIPTFKSSTGEIFEENGVPVGMRSMEMPFPLAKGVSLDGFKVGDLIVMTWEVRYEPRTEYRVTRVEKLPPGTKLEIE